MRNPLSRNALSESIRDDWWTIVMASGCHMGALDALPSGPLRILGSSGKTEAGESIGILTGVCYMAPASSSGRNVCPNATAACIAGCLGEHSGHFGFSQAVKMAQLWKTTLRFGCPERFDLILENDVDALIVKAERNRMAAAVRLDGTSDIGDAERWWYRYPDVGWYEYTKSVPRATRWERWNHPNLSVTLSFSGENRAACIAHLGNGGRVAVPFDVKKGSGFPATWQGFPIIDGDRNDWRGDDPPGSVVGLSWKGPRATRDAARDNGWLQEGVAS